MLNEQDIAAMADRMKKRMIERYERLQEKDAYILSHLDEILSLSMEGWPKTTLMKDYIKWVDFVFHLKIKGIYGISTSSCDIIANIHRRAVLLKEIKNNSINQNP